MLITKIEMVLNRKKSLTRATTHLFLSLPSFSESNVHKKNLTQEGKIITIPRVFFTPKSVLIMNKR